MKPLNKKQIELLNALKDERIVLVPIHDNKGSPLMMSPPYDKVSRSTLNALLRRGFVDEEEESDGYTTRRITNSGKLYLNDYGSGNTIKNLLI